jgi:hypothetical protein
MAGSSPTPETPDETIARLTAELREARDQQAATTEILEIINRSPGDLAPVFDAILERAHTLCEAAYGSLYLFNGEKIRDVGLRRHKQEYVIEKPIVVGDRRDVRALKGSVRRLNSLGKRRVTNGSAQICKPPAARCSSNTIFQLS